MLCWFTVLLSIFSPSLAHAAEEPVYEFKTGAKLNFSHQWVEYADPEGATRLLLKGPVRFFESQSKGSVSPHSFMISTTEKHKVTFLGIDDTIYAVDSSGAFQEVGKIKGEDIIRLTKTVSRRIHGNPIRVLSIASKSSSAQHIKRRGVVLIHRQSSQAPLSFASVSLFEEPQAILSADPNGMDLDLKDLGPYISYNEYDLRQAFSLVRTSGERVFSFILKEAASSVYITRCVAGEVSNETLYPEAMRNLEYCHRPIRERLKNAILAESKKLNIPVVMTIEEQQANPHALLVDPVDFEKTHAALIQVTTQTFDHDFNLLMNILPEVISKAFQKIRVEQEANGVENARLRPLQDGWCEALVTWRGMIPPGFSVSP